MKRYHPMPNSPDGMVPIENGPWVRFEEADAELQEHLKLESDSLSTIVGLKNICEERSREVRFLKAELEKAKHNQCNCCPPEDPSTVLVDKQLYWRCECEAPDNFQHESTDCCAKCGLNRPVHEHSWDGDQCHYCHIPRSAVTVIDDAPFNGYCDGCKKPCSQCQCLSNALRISRGYRP